MYINIHTHQSVNNNQNILQVYNQYPWNFIENNMNYSIGIHPIFIANASIEEDLKTIKSHIRMKKCLAIGEIGLDKRCPLNFDLQITIFKQQLQIAEEYQIPVIIHCVRSYQEILQIRKELHLTIPFIFHGFNKNQNLLNQILSNGCIPSFGKNLLYNQNLQTIFAHLDDNYFFLENDDSQIPIEEIYHKAAEIKGIEIEVLKKIINRNFDHIFKI